MTKSEAKEIANKIKTADKEAMDIIWPAICEWQSDERNEKTELKVVPFEYINRCNPNQIFTMLRNEHPQTLAVCLYFLNKERAQFILDNLDIELKTELIRRLSNLKNIDPYIIRNIERNLEKCLSEFDSAMLENPIEKAAELFDINNKELVENLEDYDPELAEELKARIFVFKDITKLSDRAIQKAMREIDSQELAKALINTEADVQNKIFNNMSKRAADMIKEDIVYMGPVKLIDITEAQRKIVSVISYLKDIGDIVVSNNNEILAEEKYVEQEIVKDDKRDLIAYKDIEPNEKVKAAFNDGGKMLQIIDSIMHKKLITVLDNKYIYALVSKDHSLSSMKLLMEGLIKSIKINDIDKVKNLYEIFGYVEELEYMSKDIGGNRG